jgi:outer membrane cobalamin receptor
VKNTILIPLGFIVPLATANIAQAEESRLKDVFVSAARSEQSLDAVNASVEVINAEKIRTFAGRSLSEVLQYATGTLVRDSGSSSSFSLRGQDSDKTLILVDGLRRTEKYAGANLNNIQLEDVERIEIVRGSMSALYGSDALGGVINIITRGPQKGSTAGVRLMASSAIAFPSKPSAATVIDCRLATSAPPTSTTRSAIFLLIAATSRPRSGGSTGASNLRARMTMAWA